MSFNGVSSQSIIHITHHGLTSSCTSSLTLICRSHHSFGGGGESCSCAGALMTLVLLSWKLYRFRSQSALSSASRSCACSACLTRRSLPPLCVLRCMGGADFLIEGEAVPGGLMDASGGRGELFLPGIFVLQRLMVPMRPARDPRFSSWS